MRLKNELKIGLTIVMAVLIGFVGFRVMKDAPIFRQGTIVYAKYPRVDGLSVGTSVLVNGIKVGSVRELRLLPDDSVRVTLNINMIDGLPEGSVAYIRAVDILGTKGVDVVRGTSARIIPYGGSLKGIYDDGFFGELSSRGTEIASNVSRSTDKIDALLADLQQMLRDGGRQNIELTLQNVQSTSAQIDRLITDTNDDIKASVASLRSMMGNLDELTSEERGELQRLLQNLERTSAEFEEISRSLNTVSSDLAEITRKINDGEGTLGRLVNDPSLYERADSLTNNLNRLIQDFNENPRHFLRHIRLIDIF